MMIIAGIVIWLCLIVLVLKFFEAATERRDKDERR